jgi:hypothetical protein
VKHPYNYYIESSDLSVFPSEQKFGYLISVINIHYIHSVLVQDFVSGRACCMKQYHCESLKRRVVMLLVHTSLLCELVSLRVVKATSCDAVSSHEPVV